MKKAAASHPYRLRLCERNANPHSPLFLAVYVVCEYQLYVLKAMHFNIAQARMPWRIDKRRGGVRGITGRRKGAAEEHERRGQMKGVFICPGRVAFMRKGRAECCRNSVHGQQPAGQSRNCCPDNYAGQRWGAVHITAAGQPAVCRSERAGAARG